MTDPTRPRTRGRHSSPDAGGDAPRPASELLAAWGGAGVDTLQQADSPARPRRRRYAPDTGVDVLAPRGAADVAEVEITGLDAVGMADAGLAAAGLDLSVFGIDPAEPVRRRAVDPAPRTTEMRAVPPAVPLLADHDRSGPAPALDRRTTPTPRPAAEPTSADRVAADRVAADRFAEAATEPGWLSGADRLPAVPVGEPHAAAARAPRGVGARRPPAGPAVASADEPAADEPATDVHDAVSAVDGHGDADVRDDHAEDHGDGDRHGNDDGRPPLSDRHRARPTEDDGDEQAAPQDRDDPHETAGPATVFDETGGLEVIVADGHDDGADHESPDDLLDGGSGGRGGGSGRSRGRRRPITLVLSLLLLAGLVGGIVVGGKALWNSVNPAAEDYAGAGTGSVDVRVNDGDTLRAIAGSLVQAGVIASSGPFEDAAEANPAATGIQPGVYSMRQQMSGQAALDLLLDPASRQMSRVTLPEGLTVDQTLERLAEDADLPLDQLKAAAADPAALGLPPYANGLLEGFLFPATYDIEPGDTPASVLSEMVAGTVRVLDELQIPVEQRLGVVTEASMVQAEAGSIEDMGKVARVLDNRLADGMPLQLDATVNYANGKSGITTTAADRQNPSPYNTYVHTGLPPGAIGNPGEEALRAVLNPTPGDWRFFVVVDPSTGETRFAVTGQEHSQNVLLFQQWLQDNPGN